MLELQQLLESILPLDAAAMDAAQKRQADLAKPPGSLGRLEELSVQVDGYTIPSGTPIFWCLLQIMVWWKKGCPVPRSLSPGSRPST